MQSSIRETDIKTEDDINIAIARQSIIEQKRSQRVANRKRIGGLLVLGFLFAGYLQWHHSGGEQHFLLDLFVQFAIIYTIANAVLSIVRPKL